MSKKRRVVLPVLIIIIIVFIAGSAIKSRLEGNLEKLSDIVIENIDLSKVKDGIYTGKSEVFPVAAEVNVTIKNHTISGIELVKHNNGRGAAAEIIPSKVVEGQTLEIDTIAGATYSSKVILKAIENALINSAK